MKEYVIGDAISVMDNEIEDGSVSFIHLDDAWARPKRDGAFGVEYPTHPFEEGDGVVTTNVIDSCFSLLEEGGWLIMSVDDWLLPRAIDHIRTAHGDVNATYRGGGYRKTGRVVYTKADGTPNRRLPGKYFRSAGYPVIFAHKGSTEKSSSESAAQLTTAPSEKYGWGSVKPTEPYEVWIDALTDPGDLIVEPMAGTAPALLAAEAVYGDDISYIGIDIEEAARQAHLQRRSEVDAPTPDGVSA